MVDIIHVSKKKKKKGAKFYLGSLQKSSYVHLAVTCICEIMEQFFILKLNSCALHSGLYT